LAKALAKLFHDLGYGHANMKSEEGLKKLIKAISSNELDFSHKNDLWRALFYSDDERMKKFPGIEKYIHVPSGTNLDAGNYDEDNGWVRYGSRHNDIFPRLGDSIRWKLNLKPRPSVTRSIKKAA